MTTRPGDRIGEVFAWLVILLASLTAISVQAGRGGASSEPIATELSIGGGFQMNASYVLGLGELLGEKMSYSDERVATEIGQLAKSPADRLGHAIVLASFGRTEDSDKILDQLAGQGDAQAKAVELIRSLMNGSASNDELVVARIRLGWFADSAHALSLSNGAERQQALDALSARHRKTAGLLLGFAVLLVGAMGLGFALLITGFVLWILKKLSFKGWPAPTRPGLFIEAFAIYLAALILPMSIPVESVGMRLGLMGVLMLGVVLAIWWPSLRGLDVRTNLQTVGLTRGRGIIVESLLGVAGYMALLPLLAVGFGLTLLLMRMSGESASHPIQETLSGDWPVLFVAFGLGVIFAPVTEEILFRGSFFTGLSARIGWILSAFATGMLFAAIHPQGWVAIPVLGMIGVNLAIIRRWRGSLVGPIVAHALNNGTVLLLGVMLARV
jgi:membrane protease YdiL (CAAX protease family)